MDKLKRTLALTAALAMTATAFVGCGGNDSSSTSESKAESSAEDSSEADADSAEDSTAEEESSVESAAGYTNVDVPALGEPDGSLKDGGDKLTILCWNDDDLKYMYDIVADATGMDKSMINYKNVGSNGTDANEQYAQVFLSGDDVDLYFCDADWNMAYQNNDEYSAPLSAVGISEDMYANAYDYTVAMGKDKNGVLKGASWQAAAGGFAYRADLAEQYLGVTTPAEMQEKVGDWAKFTEAAKTISDATSGTVALGDTLGGMWQVYACGRTTPWVKDNKLQIDDFCKEFADTAKELWDMGGITKNDQWSNEWTASGVQGSTMGYFVSTWGFGGFFLDAAGGVGGDQYGKWNVCQGPQAFYWGGTWLVVNADTDNGNECRDFILSAAGDDDQMKAYAAAKPEFVNNKAVMDEIIGANTVFNEDISGNFKDGQNYFAELAGNVEKINFNGLITEHDATIKTDFVTAVKEEYLMGGKSWDETVDRFKDDVAEDIMTIEVD